ncbi:protein kinase [Candidatus Berkiella cookevillensis]|uniref:Protein kinase n=1 Tax=Candidatus Berkiella cookevillensis TaxID=437022 RepID=A0A0Q9YNA1_9GAMM|nr:protein kinase [Candidatus Berkiella cookevillensis]MCS5708741.1 protein kinase [Candidatus Berkiella cookevillensis]
MPFQNFRDAITALDELIANIRKNSPSASTEQIQYTIQNWSQMHFTASEADAKILGRVKTVLHQDKIAAGQGMLGFSNENASFLKEKSGSDHGIFFKSFAEQKKTPAQEAAERRAKEREQLESERQALQLEQQSIQEMLARLKEIGSEISSAIPAGMTHIPFSQLKSTLDPTIKEHEDVLKLVREFESLKSNLDDYEKKNNNSQIRQFEANIRNRLGDSAQMSMTIDFIRQNMSLLMVARQVVQRIEPSSPIQSPVQENTAIFEQAIANAKTAEQLANAIRSFQGSIINSQGNKIDKNILAFNVIAILSDKEVVAQIHARGGLPLEHVRGYGLTGAHGIYGKFMQLVTQKHEENLRADADFRQRIGTANNLKELIEIIRAHPGELSAQNGQPLNKATMIHRLEVIANQPAVLKSVVDDIYQWGGSELTGNYGLRNKIQECAQKEYMAAKAREEAQSNPSVKADELIKKVKSEINYTHMIWGIGREDRREEFITSLLEKLDGLVKNKDMSSEQKLQNLNVLLQEAINIQEPGAHNFKRIVKDVFEKAKKTPEFSPHAQPQQKKPDNVQPQNNSSPVAPEPKMQQSKSAPQQNYPETKGLLSIKKKDWEKAKQYFAENPNAVKFARKGNKISNSFIQVEGEIFAVKSGKCLGEGAFGKVKILQNEEKVNFAVKIEGRGKRGNDDAELKAMKLIGQLKGEATRSYGKTFKGEYAPDKLYTVMQLHQGKELWDQLYIEVARDEYAEKNISEEKKLLFAVKAAEAIKHLHEHRIIHADIKPQNFMANAKGNLITVGAIDFGFAMILPPGQDKIIGDSAKGTPGYAAPEVYHHEYSFASDIYALGVMYQEDFGIKIPDILSYDPALRPNMEQLLDQLYKKLEAASHLSNTTKDLLEQRKVDKIPDLLSMNKENIEDLYKFHSRSHSSSSVGRWMSNLHKDAGKAVFGKEKIRQEQIQLLSDCIAHVNKDPSMEQDKKAEKIYSILIKIESEIGREHNSRESGMDKMIKAQKQNLETVYPALKDPQKAEAIQKVGVDILKEVRPAEEVKENGKQRFR